MSVYGQNLRDLDEIWGKRVFLFHPGGHELIRAPLWKNFLSLRLVSTESFQKDTIKFYCSQQSFVKFLRPLCLFSLTAHCLQTSHSAHIRLPMHPQMYTHMNIQCIKTNKLACRQTQICVSAHMQFLSFFLPFFSWQTNSCMHKHSPLLPDFSVYVSAPMATPFPLFLLLYPSVCFLFPNPSCPCLDNPKFNWSRKCS